MLENALIGITLGALAAGMLFWSWFANELSYKPYQPQQPTLRFFGLFFGVMCALIPLAMISDDPSAWPSLPGDIVGGLGALYALWRGTLALRRRIADSEKAPS